MEVWMWRGHLGAGKLFFATYTKMTSRPVSTVLMEALVIGVMNAALIFVVGKMKIDIETPILHLIAGALIHIIFEYTGGNKWWCTQTYKL
jgi:hypothetical protein